MTSGHSDWVLCQGVDSVAAAADFIILSRTNWIFSCC